jgi:hypothetical protein
MPSKSIFLFAPDGAVAPFKFGIPEPDGAREPQVDVA